MIRGLSEDDVAGIIERRQLVRSIVIRVPSGIQPSASKPSEAVDDWVYSIEEMHASLGSVMAAGAAVCDLAYHETLLLEGQAYERDVTFLTELIKNKQPVSVALGSEDNETVIDDLPILFMDNHLDEESQTYRFYVQLSNSVVAENVDGQRRFRTWRFNQVNAGMSGCLSNNGQTGWFCRRQPSRKMALIT